MATFDIETAACDFTELLSEELVAGNSIVEDIDYPTHNETATIRLTLAETEEDTWVEVIVEEEGLKGILVEGFGEYRGEIDQYTDCYQQLVEIKKLWEQFLKA